MVLNESSCLEKDVKKEEGISANYLGQLLYKDLRFQTTERSLYVLRRQKIIMK